MPLASILSNLYELNLDTLEQFYEMEVKSEIALQCKTRVFTPSDIQRVGLGEILQKEACKSVYKTSPNGKVLPKSTEKSHKVESQGSNEQKLLVPPEVQNNFDSTTILSDVTEMELAQTATKNLKKAKRGGRKSKVENKARQDLQLEAENIMSQSLTNSRVTRTGRVSRPNKTFNHFVMSPTLNYHMGELQHCGLDKANNHSSQGNIAGIMDQNASVNEKTPETQKLKGKRGRKKKDVNSVEGDILKLENGSIEKNEVILTPKTNRKRGKPKVSLPEVKLSDLNDQTNIETEILDNSTTIQSSSLADEDDPVEKETVRGKRKLSLVDNPIINTFSSPGEHELENTTSMQMRLLAESLINDIKEQIATTTEAKTKKPNQTQTCAVCKLHLKSTEWSVHKERKHANVAWRTKDEPLDLDNYQNVLLELRKLYPAKLYNCDLCGDKKKSPLGYLTHKLTCSKTSEQIEQLKVKCYECDRKVMRHQVVEHSKAHYQAKLNPEKKIKLETNWKKESKNEVYNLQYKTLIRILVEDIRKEMELSEQVERVDDNLVTCAICKQHIVPSKWTIHKQVQHNNIAWKTTEMPLDLDNYTIVLSILNALYPSKPYNCNACNDSKKSVLGFLTHKLTCNKSPEEIESYKMPCKDCSKILMPHQLVDHDKYHKRYETIQMQEPDMESKENQGAEMPRKRVAASKATHLIQQVTRQLSLTSSDSNLSLKMTLKYVIRNNSSAGKVQAVVEKLFKSGVEVNCLFDQCISKFTELSQLLQHLSACNKKPEKYFICIFCANTYVSLVDARRHLMDNHSDNINIDQDSDTYIESDDNSLDEFDDDFGEPETDIETTLKTRKFPPNSEIHVNSNWKLAKFSSLQRYEDDRKVRYPTCYGKTLDFCKQHFVTDGSVLMAFNLEKFPWFPLNKNYIVDYLPQLRNSMHIEFDNFGTKIEKKFKLFETFMTNGTINIFCGGPITAMAWAPTPYDREDCKQILAVSVNRSPDINYDLKKNHTNKSMIQLWNFGYLKNKTALETPTLEMCIAHNFGGVFSMTWCPSGCYDESTSLLGLLAICSTDSNVYCYCVNRNLLTDKVFKPKPVVKLVLSKQCVIQFGTTPYFPTQLSWSKAIGHKYIAVGYTNGIVALYNLLPENLFLEDTDDANIRIIYPYRTIVAHHCDITAVSIHHFDGGNRWLATSSGDREWKFWDLHAPNDKVQIDSKRAGINNFYWPINSISILGSNDDSSNRAYLATAPMNVVDFDYVRPTNILNSQSPVRCITGSDWCSVAYQCNEAGEIIGATYRDMYPFVMEVPFKKFMCANAKLVSNESQSAKEQSNNHYEGVAKNCKLIIRDYKLDIPRNLFKMDKVPKACKIADTSKYPAESATVICTNNNRYNYMFTAVGYHIGLLRIFQSRFLD